MAQFILTNIFMVSVGVLLYFVIRTIPRIEPETGAPDTKGFLERFVISKIPERVDGAVNSFLFKFLKKFKIVLLKVDNVVGRQLKKVHPEKESIENGEKPVIDFTDIKSNNKDVSR